MLHTETAHSLRHELVAGTVQRGIDDAKLIGSLGDHRGIDGLTQHLLEERLVSLIAEQLYHAALERTLKVALGIEYTIEDIGLCYLCGYGIRLLRSELSAVRPVCLISVILLRIVRGGDIHTRCRAESAHRKGQLRGRLNRSEEIYLDPVVRHDRRSGAGETTRIVSAVAAYHNAALYSVLSAGTDVRGKALCRLRNGIDIHIMHAHSHRTAKSRRTEAEQRAEALLYLVLIASQSLKLRSLALSELIRREPALVVLHEFFQCFFSY